MTNGGSISGLFYGQGSSQPAWPYDIYGVNPNLTTLCCPIDRIKSQLKLNYYPYYVVPIEGICEVTNGSANVVGSNTFFTYDLFNSQFISINDSVYQILSIPDDTHLTLMSPYTGIDSSNSLILIDSEDTQLLLISHAVQEYAELYTRRDFLIKQYVTFRDNFNFIGQINTLRRSKLISIDRVTYLVNGVCTTVDPLIYYAVTDNDYGAIALRQCSQWPTDGDIRFQDVRIYFTVGYGDSFRNIPKDLLMGMLNHAAAMYMNRGDCSESGCQSSLPPESRRAYEKYKIQLITGNDYAGKTNGYGASRNFLV